MPQIELAYNQYPKVTSKETRLGNIAAEMIRHATEKHAIVNDLSTRMSKTRHAENYERLFLEKLRQADKLAMRKRPVDDLVRANVELRLTNLEDGTIAASGLLAAVDLRKAQLQLAQETGEPVSVDYAANLPIPEGLNQTYFGHRLLVGFEIVSIPEDQQWILR